MVPESEHRLLAEGKQVAMLREIEGQPWPEVVVVQRSSAPADLVAAVFLDYERAPSFIRKLESAEVVRSVGEETDVRYRVRLPVLLSVGYSTRNVYRKNGQVHSVKWRLLESPVASSGHGEFRVEPWGDGSVVAYTSLVSPSNRVVAALKSLAIEEVKSTVSAIVGEADRLAAVR